MRLSQAYGVLGDVMSDDFIMPAPQSERIKQFAEGMKNAIEAMEPGQKFTIERHDENDEKRLFTLTFTEPTE